MLKRALFRLEAEKTQFPCPVSLFWEASGPNVPYLLTYADLCPKGPQRGPKQAQGARELSKSTLFRLKGGREAEKRSLACFAVRRRWLRPSRAGRITARCSKGY